MKRIYTLLACAFVATVLSAQTEKRYVLFGSEGQDAKAVAADEIQKISWGNGNATVIKSDGSTITADMASMTTPLLAPAVVNNNVEEVDTAVYRTFMCNKREYQVRVTRNWSEDTYVADPRYVTVRLWHETGQETSEGTSMKFWVLTYDKTLTRVDTIKQLSVVNDEENFKEEWITEYEYVFSYDENGHLTGVVNGTRDIVKDVTYNSNGLLDTYSVREGTTRNFKTYQAKYAVVNNELLRIDCMDSGDNFVVADRMIPNPNYIEGLPAVIPGSVSDIPLYFIYNKYMYNGTESNPVTWDYGKYRNGLKSYDAWTASFSANDISWNIYFIKENQ